MIDTGGLPIEEDVIQAIIEKSRGARDTGGKKDAPPVQPAQATTIPLDPFSGTSAEGEDTGKLSQSEKEHQEQVNRNKLKDYIKNTQSNDIIQQLVTKVTKV